MKLKKKAKKSVVIVRDIATNQYLIGMRNDTHKWTIVGGGYDKKKDFTAIDTARRELWEEANIRLPLKSFKYHKQRIEPKKIVSIFLVDIDRTKYDINNSNDPDKEFLKIEWFSKDEIMELNTHHKNDILKEYIMQK